MENNTIGALWKREGKSGEYFSGNIEINGERIKIVVFNNKFKDKDTQPDYRILKSEPKQEEQTAFTGDSGELPF